MTLNPAAPWQDVGEWSSSGRYLYRDSCVEFELTYKTNTSFLRWENYFFLEFSWFFFSKLGMTFAVFLGFYLNIKSFWVFSVKALVQFIRWIWFKATSSDFKSVEACLDLSEVCFEKSCNFFSNLETLGIYFFPNCVLSFFIFSNKELGLHHLHVVSFLISNKHMR